MRFRGFPLLLAAVAATLSSGASIGAQEVDYSRHFRVFTASGDPASLDDILEAMAGLDVVLVGETHTDPVGHWVESELFRGALDRVRAGQEQGALRPLALSLEMFERDVQGIVDEYLRDLITESQFRASARPWEYYEEDYRGMVEAAKERGVPVLAANAPRRYVNRVSRLGREALEDLPPEARAFLPPLPFPQPTEAYRAEWTALMREMTMEDQCPPPEVEEKAEDPMMPGHRVEADSGNTAHPPADSTERAGMPSHTMGDFMENGIQAQTLWDAAMAYTISTFLDKYPGALVLHMVGGFHVENFTGIPEKVRYYRPETKMLVVSLQMTDDIDAFHPEGHGGTGDFVILTDKSLDKNYERNCVDRGE